MTEAQRAAAAEISAGRRGGVVGPFAAALRSPECMRRLQHLGAYLRYDSAIDSAAARSGHPADGAALEAGLRVGARTSRWRAPRASPPATIDAIAAGTVPPRLDPARRSCSSCAPRSLPTAACSDALYARAIDVLGEPGLIDLVSAVGYYSTLALIMNVTRTALPEGAVAPDWG